eukprot:4351898-Pyramimonas_sp.AAC.1
MYNMYNIYRMYNIYSPYTACTACKRIQDIKERLTGDRRTHHRFVITWAIVSLIGCFDGIVLRTHTIGLGAGGGCGAKHIFGFGH